MSHSSIKNIISEKFAYAPSSSKFLVQPTRRLTSKFFLEFIINNHFRLNYVFLLQSS